MPGGSEGDWRDQCRDDSSGWDCDRHSIPLPGSEEYCVDGNDCHDSWLHDLPRGTPLPSAMSAMDAISQVVASVPPVHMMEILSSMKNFILKHPERAHALLTANPQLRYALFQALLVYNIVDPGILHHMMGNSLVQRPHISHCSTAPRLNQDLGSVSEVPSHPLPLAQPVRQALPPPPTYRINLPPSAHTGHLQAAQPPHLASGSAQSGTFVGADPMSVAPDAQRDFMMHMLQLTDQELSLFPHDQRQAILQLKSNFMMLGNIHGGS